MAGTEQYNNTGTGQAGEFGQENDFVLDDQNQEENKPRGKKVIYALVVLSIVILVFALFAAFTFMQQYDGEAAAQQEAGASLGRATEGIVEVTEAFMTDAIIVARQTDYIFYNANLDENMRVIDPTIGAQMTTPEGDLVFTSGQAGTAQNQTTTNLGANYSSLLGIDVLDAQSRARNEGYVVHQVFVVCPNVVNNNAPAPRPGEVLDVQTYTMRGDGQRYMFLHVMTTEPVANARTVPNLAGVQWQTGRDRLRAVDLGPRYVYERQSPDTKGVVLFQAPQAGRFTPAGSTVIMVLAD